MENEYVIAYTYKGQRRYERICARGPEEAKDLFRGRHTERIDSCALAKYSTQRWKKPLKWLLFLVFFRIILQCEVA